MSIRLCITSALDGNENHTKERKRAVVAKNYRTVEPRMLNQKQAEEYTGMGRNTLTEFSRQIGARRKIGKKILYDRRIIDAGLDALEADQAD